MPSKHKYDNWCRKQREGRVQKGQRTPTRSLCQPLPSACTASCRPLPTCWDVVNEQREADEQHTCQPGLYILRSCCCCLLNATDTIIAYYGLQVEDRGWITTAEKERFNLQQSTQNYLLAFPGRWQQMVPPLTTSLAGHSSFCTWAEKQQKTFSNIKNCQVNTYPAPKSLKYKSFKLKTTSL